MVSIPNKPLFFKVLGIWIILINCTVVFSIYFNVFEAPRPSLEVFTTINLLIIATIMAFTLPKGIWSICFIFFISFSMFHGGLMLASSVNGITDEDTLYQISRWYYSVETDNAIHLFNLGMIGFSLGAVLFSKVAPIAEDSEVSDVFKKRIYNLGGFLLIFMVSLFFGVGFGTGAIGSYGAYLATLDAIPLLGTIFAYIYLFIGLSLVFISVAYRKGFGYLYFIIFAVWAGFAFKLGLRGEVMFPGTVAGCILGRRGAPVNGFTLLIMTVCFLILTGIVKNARISGDYSAVDSVNPLNAVAEMGASLRPVQEVIKWRKNGDQLLWGGSYWAPVERQLAHFVPGLHRKPGVEDRRLLNVVVSERAGPIGFSPVAEAYLNFGERGVLLVFLFLGALMAYFDSQPSRLRYDILVGASLVPLFIMIRNSFAPVPVQILVGIVLAHIVMYVAITRFRG
jgi:hypothetical protein